MSRVITQDDLYQIMRHYEARISAIERRLNKFSLNYSTTGVYTKTYTINPGTATTSAIANTLATLIDDLR